MQFYYIMKYYREKSRSGKLVRKNQRRRSLSSRDFAQKQDGNIYKRIYYQYNKNSKIQTEIVVQIQFKFAFDKTFRMFGNIYQNWFTGFLILF